MTKATLATPGEESNNPTIEAECGRCGGLVINAKWEDGTPATIERDRVGQGDVGLTPSLLDTRKIVAFPSGTRTPFRRHRCAGAFSKISMRKVRS